jgi:phosphoglycolate phosphatase
MPSIRLAIFDLDGTLVDSVDDLSASVNHALAAVGLPLRSREEVRSFVGEGARLLIERSVAPHAEKADAALAAWQAHYDAHCLDATRAYPGIAALLAGARCALAVHTNKPAPLARKILAGLGLLGRFAAVVGGGDAPRKPDPTGVAMIRGVAGAAAEETVFVGDSPVDVATARAAGVRLVAVTWGLSTRAELARAGATELAESAADLAALLG